MTAENYIVLSLGVIALIAGPLIARNSRKLFEITADANRALGGAPGRQVAKRGSAKWVRACGIALTIFGIIFLLAGIFVRG